MTECIFKSLNSMILFLYSTPVIVGIGYKDIVAQLLGALYVRQLCAVVQGIVDDQSDREVHEVRQDTQALFQIDSLPGPLSGKHVSASMDENNQFLGLT